MLKGFQWEPRVVDGRIWQPQNDGIAGATIIRLTDFPRFASSATPVAGGPRVITFVSQCTISQPGEEFLIPNSLQSREIPCYSHQLGQSFPHLLGNVENGKSEKKSFGIWSGSPRRNLLVAFGSTLAYLEKTPASEVSNASMRTEGSVSSNRTGSNRHPHMAERPAHERL